MLHATGATLHHSDSQACTHTLHTPQKKQLKITEKRLGIIKHHAQGGIREVPQIIMKGLNISFLRKNSAKLPDRTVQVRGYFRAALPVPFFHSPFLQQNRVECTVDTVTAICNFLPCNLYLKQQL